MVTPYAPHRDGIAAYALQSVAALNREGHEVTVLSPGPSAAQLHLDLHGPRGAIALGRRIRGFDKVIVQYHPDVFYRLPAPPGQIAATSLALAAAFRLARVEVRIHEIDYRWGKGTGPVALASKLLWKTVDKIAVHTELERGQFIEAFGVDPSRVEIADHGADFTRKTSLDRRNARISLDIADDAFVFLSLGFLQPHKGFDRAIRAFASSGLAGTGARLDVAGSARLEDAAVMSHVEELAQLADATPGAHLHEGYLSDELFDRWLVAADVVVLPYRHIWSSSVLERAALYERPVIATRLGTLAQQGEMALGQKATLIPDGPQFETQLAAAMQAAAVGRASGPVDEPVAVGPWPTDGRIDIQDEVVLRAAVRRGAQIPMLPRPAGGVVASGAASAPVRRLDALALPPPTSTRLVARLLKLGVRKLTAWQTDPLVWQINALREASIRALDIAGAPADPPPQVERPHVKRPLKRSSRPRGRAED